MAPPLVTFTVNTPDEGSTDPETVTVRWDFRPSSGPALKGPLQVRLEWRPLDRPPIQETKLSVLRVGPTKVSSAGNAAPAASEDDDLTVFALVTVRRRFHQGVLVAIVDWTPKRDTEEVKGPQSFTKTEPMGDQVNADQTRTGVTVVPRISEALRAPLSPEEQVAIKTSESEPQDDSRFVFNGNQVLRVLKHIHGRLRAGLGGFWAAFGEQCLDPETQLALSEVPDDELERLSRDQLEESWAQLVSEMIVGAAYHGPGSYMAAGRVTDLPPGTHSVHLQDASFFRLVKRQAEAGDLVFPLNVACQQLSTMVLMTRSSDFFELSRDPLDCGSPIPNGSLPGKQHFRGPKTSLTMAEAEKNGWLAPGVSFFRDPRIRHVATVIRAFKSQRAQLLDTGGWNTTFPEPFNVASGKTPGIAYDTKEVKQLNDTLKDLPGPPQLGVAIPPAVSDDKLIEALKLLKRARPIGVARLVIAKRGVAGEKGVLWVSRKLHLHEEDDGFHRYPVTRLLASLRGCPHLDRLDVRWQLFVPVGELALENVFSNGRSERWWEGPQSESKKVDGKTQTSRTKHTIRPLSEWGTGTDGIPKVLQRDMQGVTTLTRYPLFLDKLEDAVDAAALRKDFPELADVPNGQLPKYFQK